MRDLVAPTDLDDGQVAWNEKAGSVGQLSGKAFDNDKGPSDWSRLDLLCKEISTNTAAHRATSFTGTLTVTYAYGHDHAPGKIPLANAITFTNELKFEKGTGDNWTVSQPEESFTTRTLYRDLHTDTVLMLSVLSVSIF